MRNDFFKLYANCLIVKGAKRAIICDVQRNKYSFIPLDLVEILINNKESTLHEIKEKYGQENLETIEEYFTFLFEKEYIFYCNKNELNLFPDLSLEWKHPSDITNAIIDFNSSTSLEIKKIIIQLEQLNVKDLQLRFYDEIEYSILKEILANFQESCIKSIELIVKFNNEISDLQLKELLFNNDRLSYVVFHSAPFNKFQKEFLRLPLNLNYIKQQITSDDHCGFISPRYFSPNIQTFTESQKHNTCLNRKISIDVNGEIKNCPSMKKSYGNIKNISLDEVVKIEDFKKPWFIHKDNITVCKDCEFRHICTDCRAFIEDTNDIYSKPKKCSYDPYNAIWSKDNLTNNPLYGK